MHGPQGEDTAHQGKGKIQKHQKGQARGFECDKKEEQNEDDNRWRYQSLYAR